MNIPHRRIPPLPILMPWLLVVELTLICAYYTLSDHGIRAEWAYNKKAAALSADIARYQDESRALARMLDRWHRYPWYREQAAREKLGMIYPNEEVYLLPT